LYYLEHKERDKVFTEYDQTSHLKEVVDGYRIARILGKNGRVKVERHEVHEEWNEQRAVDGCIVSFPHELDENADLIA
jgi:hypothetical protein